MGGNVYHVCRGSVLELEGKKYLCFGGTESPDKEEREAGYNWWPQEMPSDEEYAACEANLEANGWPAAPAPRRQRVVSVCLKVRTPVSPPIFCFYICLIST